MISGRIRTAAFRVQILRRERSNWCVGLRSIPALIVTFWTVHGILFLTVIIEILTKLLNGHWLGDYTSGVGGSGLDGLMLSHKIVIEEVNANHGFVVLQLLGESISQAHKAPHIHPHGEVLALYMAGADVVKIRRATDLLYIGTDYDIVAVFILTVNLHKTAMIDALRAECTTDSKEVCTVAVCANLDALSQA